MHPYPIMKLFQLSNGQKLVKIRCPWEKGEWEGPWANGTTEWQPEILQELKISAYDNGNFFMCKFFEEEQIIQICF